MLSSSVRFRIPLAVQRLPSSFRRLPFSTNTAAVQSSTTWNNQRWRIIARTVRYARIPFLIVSVYGLGYQQGIIDDSRNPEETRGKLLDSVLAGVGASREASDVIQDGEQGALLFSTTSHHPQTRRVAGIARKLVTVAKVHVKSQLEAAFHLVQSKLPSDVTKEQLYQAFHRDEGCQRWTMALRQLEGDWSYFLLQTNLPNAFVTEILPKRIFVTTAMFQIIENDDELALILGHEISHLILGHLSDQHAMEMILRTIEVLLLSMDPTEGVLALGVIGVLATIRKALTSAHSRDHEREADELGVQLAAMACFDTKKAAKVFNKLHAIETGGETATTNIKPNWIRFVDSHPSSAERFKDLLLASETENAEKYALTTCQDVGQRLRAIWK